MYMYVYLEYVGEVSEVEDVVELDSSRQECDCHLHVTCIILYMCTDYAYSTVITTAVYDHDF